MRSIITFLAILICHVSMSQIPVLSVNNNDKKESLSISTLHVNVDVVGNIATTTYDITFYNPINRQLQGELSMPMSDGQEICRYALGINGKLREGVVIEKVKARQTFEAIVRRNIDPGIVSKTKGNFFKTMIFPIPAKGNKRVVLSISETLKGDAKNLFYSLPMNDSRSIADFKLDVKVFKSSVKEKKPSRFNSLKFDNKDDAYCLSFERKDYTAKEPIKFTIPRFSKKDYQLYTCDLDGETYFYLNMKSPKLSKKVKREASSIAVYWDNSLSASKRDLEKELSLLDTYLNSIKGKKRVYLTCFNNSLSKEKLFKIGNNTKDLISYLKGLKYDGATSLDNIKLNTKVDEILFFSDAINTIGSEDILTSKTPIYTISSASGSNYTLLKKLALESNGEFINLNVLSEDKALSLMSIDQEKFISLKMNKNELKDVYPNTPRRVGEYFEVVGVLKSNKASLTLDFGNKNKITQSKTFLVEKGESAPISRIWASKVIASLEMDYKKNKKEITALGRKFNIVTRNTSFIVLDRIEDYLQYDIVPPVEMQDEFYSRRKEYKNRGHFNKKSVDKRNLQRIKNLISWYEQPIKPSVKKKELLVRGYARNQRRVDASEDFDDELEIEDVEADAVANEEEAPSGLASPNNKNKKNSSIRVLAWLPDAPYMKEIRKTALKDFDKLYYKLRKENKTRPAFYIEVADYLFDKKQDTKAIRILSNVLELDLENPELLKTVARRFLDEREFDLAIKIYNEIKELRPEEPHSFRDLAHAYTKNKEYQKAFDMYKFILESDWNRFEDIKDVIFNELNSLVALHKADLNIESLPKEYIKSMPLDVRITIDWSSNNNDIDLWVVDPNGEKCFYQNKRTLLGGKITRDFTQGYGPEEFSLKTAKRGLYTVFINYYSPNRQSITGPVTVYARLYTHYGTAEEEMKLISIQLKDLKQTTQVGQLEFINN
ncbi:MAG: VIT domain-containing protein [Marinifilaceae bacterium]